MKIGERIAARGVWHRTIPYVGENGGCYEARIPAQPDDPRLTVRYIADGEVAMSGANYMTWGKTLVVRAYNAGDEDLELSIDLDHQQVASDVLAKVDQYRRSLNLL